MLKVSAARNTGSDTRESQRESLVVEIGERMMATRAAMKRQGFRRLLGQSISLTHLHILTVLRSEGPLPMSELARVLDVSVASATGIVSRMEERGLVERTRGTADRRVVTVRLAPGGDAALDQVEGRGREQVERLLRHLTLDELQRLHEGLGALERARQEILVEEKEETAPSQREETSKNSPSGTEVRP